MYYTDTEFVIFPLKYVRTISVFDLVLYQYLVGVPGQSVSLEGVYKHRLDLEKVILRITEELEKVDEQSNLYAYIKNKIFMMMSTYVRAYSCFHFNKKGLYKEIKEFDCRIAKLRDEWIKSTDDMWVKILVKSHYTLLMPRRIIYTVAKWVIRPFRYILYMKKVKH